MTSVSLEEHKLWCTMANKKLQSIYNELCEFESLLTEEQDDVPKLFELLETINEIQEHHQSVVEKIVSTKKSISEKRSDLQIQMELLEKSIDLLKLETNWKGKDDEGDNAME